MISTIGFVIDPMPHHLLRFHIRRRLDHIMMSFISILVAILVLQSSQYVCFAFQPISTSSSSASYSIRSTSAAAAIANHHHLPEQPCRKLVSIILSPRSSLSSSCHSILHMLSDNNNNNEDDSGDLLTTKQPSSTNVKFFELEDAFEDDGENVVGTKFFGGGAMKDELYVPEEEERALELQNVLKELETEYKRFEDGQVFGDALAKKVGLALQCAINEILYNDNYSSSQDVVASWKEDASLVWETPFPKSKNAASNSGHQQSSPLKELAASKSFYNKLDVAILSANTIKSSSSEDSSSVVEVRWDIGALWPNPWESRVLLTGTSTLTVRCEDKEDNRSSIVLLKQVDMLDGSNPKDVIGKLSSQLPPRFWDIYHIGMTPSAELDPRFDEPLSSSSTTSIISKNKGKKKGLFSSYKLSYLPPRLVTEPSLIDTNGRDGRVAQTLPNHGFTTAIKTMGPKKESFVPVSPVEISISKVENNMDGGGSLVKWSVPVPPEFASNIELPLPLLENENDDDDEDDDSLATITTASKSLTGRPTKPPPNPIESLACSYSLRPNRLVATLPFAGNPQDEEVTQLRRKLYQEVVERDGYTPKLDPVTKRPIFFFWMNDAKACFTRVGGLGMAVYEWRGFGSKSNEVGIELEC